jgi:cell shape-determining protein MreC
VKQKASQTTEQQTELQASRGVVSWLEAELAAARVGARGLTDQLRAAENRARDLESVRAERDRLAERLQAMQSEPAQQAHQNDDVFQSALAAVCSGAGRPLMESVASEKASVSMGAAKPPQRQVNVPQESAQERTALQNELTKLRQENTQLKQWLGNFGVRLG